VIISASLSPLSRSVVLASLQTAHRRHTQSLGLTLPSPTYKSDGALLWDNQPLAALVCAGWDQSPAQVAHLLGLPTEYASHLTGGGKAVRAAKSTVSLLGDLPVRSGRVRTWVLRVFSMNWTQAQLLQVMEEVEPYVTEAWYDEQRLAAAAVASYAALLELLTAKRGDQATALMLDAVAGLETPEAALVADLAAGIDPAQLRERYGHCGDDELELASPRLGELETMGGLLAPQTTAVGAPRPSQGLQQRRQQAGETIAGLAGLLQRGTVRSTLSLAQEALSAHATARDNLARVLAAVRRWSVAAAGEGIKDGRLNEPEEIFWLELEEIKQMLTGEWHSRDHVQPLILERRQTGEGDAIAKAPLFQRVQPLGVAGGEVRGPGVVIDGPAGSASNGPAAITDFPSGAIALAPSTGPGWSWLFLKAVGVVAADGDLLCHAAAVGRSWALPTVVAAVAAATESSAATPQGVIVLDPARHHAGTA